MKFCNLQRHMKRYEKCPTVKTQLDKTRLTFMGTGNPFLHSSYFPPTKHILGNAGIGRSLLSQVINFVDFKVLLKQSVVINKDLPSVGIGKLTASNPHHCNPMSNF